MALLSELVGVIAEVEGLEESFVVGVARYLREAGLISQAGRGRGAAKMQVQDAARLLIAVNSTVLAKDGPTAWADFSKFEWSDATHSQIERSTDGQFVTDRAFQPGIGLENSFELLLDLEEADGKLNLAQMIERDSPELKVEFHRTARKVTFGFYAWVYGDKQPTTITYAYGHFLPRDGEFVPEGDRLDTITISERTFLAIGEALRT